MVPRSRDSARFPVRREDLSLTPHPPPFPADTRSTRAHESHPQAQQKNHPDQQTTASPVDEHNPTLRRRPLSQRHARPRSQSYLPPQPLHAQGQAAVASQPPPPPSSAQSVFADHGGLERPLKKAKLDNGHRHELANSATVAASKLPLRNRDSQDVIATTGDASTRTRASAPGTSTVPALNSTRSTRRSTQLPVAVSEDVEKEVADLDHNDARGPAAGHGPGLPTAQSRALSERRALRSHKGGSRSKSELAMYFQNYEQMLSLDPVKPDFLTANTAVRVINDPPASVAVLSPSSPSSPNKNRYRKGQQDVHQVSTSLPAVMKNPLAQLHQTDFFEIPKPDPSLPRGEDPLSDAVYFKAHRRIERQEKQLRNIEKERAQHEKVQLDRLLDELQGHDWLRVMGISGITDTEKKLYEPKRQFFIREVAALINKFRLWREEERRRKLEKEQAVPTEPQVDDATPQTEEEEERVDAEEEISGDGEGDGEGSADGQSFGEPPDINDLDAWAAHQLHLEAKSASRGGKRAGPGPGPSSPSPPATLLPEAPPEEEQPFQSFYSKRYLRDAAISNRRRGRTRVAFGQPVPEMDEREFKLPDDILTQDAIRVCERKKRRLRRQKGENAEV